MNSKDFSFSRKKNKAFVLVTVLMLGMLLISCATAFSWFVRMQAKTSGQERINLTYKSMAHVMTNSVIALLSEISSKSNYDSPLQRWFQPFVIPVDDLGIWIVQVVPLDDKIPLRNLFLPDGNTLRKEFEDVWHEMWLKISGNINNPAEISVLDFLDRNTKARVGSYEEDYFINRYPYDISELLILSRDINPEILYGNRGRRGIADYCTIYSEGRINLNAAPLHVLELLPGLETGLAGRLVQARNEKPISSLEDVEKLPGASARVSMQLTNIINFKSRFFNLKINCINENQNINSGRSFNIIFDRSNKRIVRWEES